MDSSARLPRLRFEGRTAWLSLEGLRSLDRAVLPVLQRYLSEVSSHGEIERLVVHNPGPDFLVGIEMHWIVACMETNDFDDIRRFVEQGQWLLQTLESLPLVTVAAVDGLATGAGAEWLTAFDLVVATPRTRIGLPETGLGIYPAFGGTQRLPRRVGLAAARWLILTGEYVSASTARSLGWIDHVVEPAQLLEAARRHRPTRVRAPEIPFAPEFAGEPSALERAFARARLEELLQGEPASADLAQAAARMRHRAPVALRIADELLRSSTRLALREGLAREIEELATVYATHDARTGMRAGAAGRRAARFTGR